MSPPRNGTVSFYTPANGGGLTILQGGLGSTVLVNNDGPGFEQLFTGSLTSPSLETFSNLQLVGVGAFSSIGYSFNVHDGASYERVLRALGETLDRKLVLVSPDAVQVAEKLREQFPAITIVPVVLTFKAWVLASFSGIEQDENGHV